LNLKTAFYFPQNKNDPILTGIILCSNSNAARQNIIFSRNKIARTSKFDQIQTFEKNLAFLNKMRILPIFKNVFEKLIAEFSSFSKLFKEHGIAPNNVIRIKT